MASRSAITRLQAILIIDLIITAFAAGAYYYIQILPREPTVGSADFKVYDLIIDPDETWANQTVRISVKVDNLRDEAANYSLNLTVNDEIRGTNTIQLKGGETSSVEFTITEANEGGYSIRVGGLTGTIKIIATGTHTLSVESYPKNFAVTFTLSEENHSTPYSAILDVGKYAVSMPEEYETTSGIYRFERWEDNSTNRMRTINLVSKMPIAAYYSQVQSCPWLYIWNGTKYVFVTEVSGSGYLGYFDRSREPPAFNKPYPWDYVKLDGTQVRLKDGYYDMAMTQVTDEIIYLDATWLLVVDHSPDVNVYSTKGTEFTDPNIAGKIYTVSKDPSTPVSCINDLGEDCLPQVSKLDGVYADVHEFGKWQYFELNLDNLSSAKEIKLIVSGYTSWFPGWEKRWAELLKNPDFLASKPSVYPYLQVKDENGSWVRVPKSRDLPEFSATPRTFIFELTGLFPTNNCSIRINTLTLMHLDYIGVDITPQQNVTVHRLDQALANLHQRFYPLSNSTGNFTKYGDVTPLLHFVDDRFVIMRQGDELSFIVPNNVTPPSEGIERDFFLYACMWYKKPGNPAYNFTVDPLPFYNMSAFPYPTTESYPYDDEHLEYLMEYSTRTV